MKFRSLLLAGVTAIMFHPAQSAVVAGDIALIGMGSDTSYKSLSFVVLNTIEAGETITFTDSGWVDDAFRGGEGGATYTFPSITLPGTVITASGTDGTSWALNSGWTSADDSTLGTNGMNFSTSGDGILAFSGTSASPTFLFAISSTPFTTTSSSNNTGVPPSLTVGSTAVAKAAGPGDGDEYDNIYYSGATSFNSTAEALAAIGNSDNWTGDNTNYTPVTSFAIVPEPSAALLGSLGLLGLIRRRR